MNFQVIQIMLTGTGKRSNEEDDDNEEDDIDEDDNDDDDDDESFHDYPDEHSNESIKRPKRGKISNVNYDERDKSKRKRPKKESNCPPRRRIINKKPVNCPECDKLLSDNSSLKLHMVNFMKYFHFSLICSTLIVSSQLT